MASYPFFLTANIPTAILEEYVSLRQNYTKSVPDIYFFSPINTKDPQSLRALRTLDGVPKQDLQSLLPFADWTVQECYSFYKSYLQDLPEGGPRNWSAFTFCVMDEQTTKDSSCLLCTDAPDISDIPKQQSQQQKEPILKFCRQSIKDVVENLNVLEMMTAQFSDLGLPDDQILRFFRTSWTQHERYEDDGREIMIMVGPKEAREQQEQRIRKYAEGLKSEKNA